MDIQPAIASCKWWLGCCATTARPTQLFAAPADEEFLIALTCTFDDVAPLASRFCGAVARHPSGITASIGTACAELHLLPTADGGHLIEELIALADSVMYAAKRRGGNQAHQSAGS